jgi:small subunit ribosomal protein S20
MANHESAKKSYKQSEKKKLINKSRKSKVKTLLKKILEDVNKSDYEAAKQSFILYQSEIMKAVSKNVLKANTASRKVSSVSKLVKALSA